MKYRRRKLREKVLQIMYAYEMNGSGLSDIVDDQLSELKTPEDREFCTNLINLVIANRKKIIEKIETRLLNWDVERIAVIDKLLLQIGVGELLFAKDIPPKVTINEIIEIAKEYSTANSGKFINGILDAILLELKEKGLLDKVGRGLIDNTLSKEN